ncbi:MAG TPA: ergothioneine biosynthesis protein EgtC [Trebonia sp.]|nr:ergothioneine biosynthesis protein EgtC [Trebonia sp.]
MAYLGPPRSLGSLLIEPPHGLYRQSWAPRRQRHGTVNADGFGIGWYAPGDPAPARYRRDIPIWGDPSLPDIARVVASSAVLAAVRSATEGMAGGAAAAAPFGSGAWLFSHNGVMTGWPTLPLPPVSLPAMEAMTDSAYLWALVLDRLRDGAAPAAALADAIAAVAAAGIEGRFNFLWTDGSAIAATACGDTLWYRAVPGDAGGDSVTVASEPSDDLPGWTEVPDQHVLTAVRGLVEVQPLSAATSTATEGIG